MYRFVGRLGQEYEVGLVLYVLVLGLVHAQMMEIGGGAEGLPSNCTDPLLLLHMLAELYPFGTAAELGLGRLHLVMGSFEFHNAPLL